MEMQLFVVTVENSGFLLLHPVFRPAFCYICTYSATFNAFCFLFVMWIIYLVCSLQIMHTLISTSYQLEAGIIAFIVVTFVKLTNLYYFN